MWWPPCQTPLFLQGQYPGWLFVYCKLNCETATYNGYLSVAVCKISQADPFLRFCRQVVWTLNNREMKHLFVSLFLTFLSSLFPPSTSSIPTPPPTPPLSFLCSFFSHVFLYAHHPLLHNTKARQLKGTDGV